MKVSEAKLSHLIGHAEKQFIIPIYQRSLNGQNKV